MKRVNFTLDRATVGLLKQLADKHYGGNRSRTVRAALESLARHTGRDGWVISGYAPLRTEDRVECRSCGSEYQKGELLFRPVFERGNDPDALREIPREEWLECSLCVESL